MIKHTCEDPMGSWAFVFVLCCLSQESLTYQVERLQCLACGMELNRVIFAWSHCFITFQASTQR